MSLETSMQVRRVLVGENIGDAEFRHMVENAALHSINGFNRRFHHWVFLIFGEKVECMETLHQVALGTPSGHGHMDEEHEQCRGEGCKSCGWKGVVTRYLRS